MLTIQYFIDYSSSIEIHGTETATTVSGTVQIPFVVTLDNRNAASLLANPVYGNADIAAAVAQVRGVPTASVTF